MDVKTGTRNALYLIGFPHPTDWSQGVLEAINALDAEWSLILNQISSVTPSPLAKQRGVLETLFTTLDRALYARGAVLTLTATLRTTQEHDSQQQRDNEIYLAYSAEAARAAAAVDRQRILYVEYEDLGLADIDEAVRRRLGVKGGTLGAKVWQVEGTKTQLLFHGELDMDHRALCKSISLGASKLPALLRGALARRHHPTATATPETRPLQSPKTASQLLTRVLQAIMKRLFWRDQWRIEIFSQKGQNHSTASLAHVIAPPASDFWADPFLIRIKGRLWLIFEALPFASGKGNISAMELTEDGAPMSSPQIVLDEPWHLSYPFLFVEDNHTYMIPDASSSRQLYLYRCGDDPLQWEQLAPLISDQCLADATIIRYESRLWMFASHGDRGASMDDTLHIYVADQLTGPWKPHSMNPVKIDARSSRPAGNMWISESGSLHRVAQDCSTVYGGDTVCTRIVRLSEDEFEEEIVSGWGREFAQMDVPWHTFNQLGELQVIDRLQVTSRRSGD